jgi:uncharacterized protein
MTTLAEHLVELQRIDTLADQLRVQRERSPLRVEFSEAAARMRSWEQRRDAIRTRIAELESEVEADEQRGAELAAHLDRLERQLKTVIAPREAEALMHEISTFTTQRDELDIRELEAMEEESTLESDLAAHLADEAATRSALSSADGALSAAVADIDRQVETLAVDREAVVASIPADVLTRYTRARPQLGVVVSRLEGKQCTGCHLDLSAAELDTARADAAETGITDCPQCGRFLVIAMIGSASPQVSPE